MLLHAFGHGHGRASCFLLNPVWATLYLIHIKEEIETYNRSTVKGVSMATDDLPIMTFEDIHTLRSWLAENHAKSDGIWVHIYSKSSSFRSITFEEVLDEGLCFGWSESMRRKYDQNSYLQRFSPRKTKGTQSKRNLERVRVLIKEGRMTLPGLKVLGIDGGISSVS